MEQDNIFRIVVAATLLVAFSISGYFRSRANQSADNISPEEEGKFIYYFRSIGGLVMYGSMLLALIYPPTMQWARLSLPTWVRWTSAGVAIAMLPMIYWLFSSLGDNVTPTVVTRQEHQLVTQGPYRWIRHPLYTFGFLAIFASAITLDNWFIILTGLITINAILLRTPLEEAKLIEKFGDEYRRYMQRTGRYVPKLGIDRE
ncbi:MAG: isoprenylcysteine carboxylmethyltransferase family protein [Anaerolineales bacterium]|nr:isoprenylcysteine carboxylmethyltransferase family protein [Anaerolineales bacterium]